MCFLGTHEENALFLVIEYFLHVVFNNLKLTKFTEIVILMVASAYLHNYTKKSSHINILSHILGV